MGRLLPEITRAAGVAVAVLVPLALDVPVGHAVSSPSLGCLRDYG